MRAKDRDGIYQRAGRKGFYYRDPGTGRPRKARALYLAGARQELALAIQKYEKQRLGEEMFGITPPEPGSFRNLCQDYLEFQERRLTPEAYRREAIIVNKHLLPFFPPDLPKITRLLVEKYVVDRLATPAHAGTKLVCKATVVKEINVARHIFRRGLKHHLVAFNPFSDIEVPGYIKPKKIWFTPEQVLTLIDKSPRWLQPIARIAAGSGMRLSEILRLRQKDIDLQTGKAHLDKTKNGDERDVYLTADALEAIKSLPWSVNPDALLFPNVLREHVSRAFWTVCRHRAGIDGSFHTLRHTYCSLARQDGHELDAIGDVVGHRSLIMSQRYSHLSDDHRRAVAASVGAKLRRPNAS